MCTILFHEILRISSFVLIMKGENEKKVALNFALASRCGLYILFEQSSPLDQYNPPPTPQKEQGFRVILFKGF